tara:strand:+ start:13312 stop:13944 length:633 start_codon:yes stop_codon:yes gene_type:complete
MCAIFGSYDQEKLEELAELNSYRGQLSYSISEFDPKTKQLFLKRKSMGAFSLEHVQLNDGMYKIAHIQAPTTAASATASIHPSARNEDGDLLWHNGILKESFVEHMQKALDSDEEWDTGLLHDWILTGKELSKVDGTFACVRCNNYDMRIFRNEISPMFYDGNLNISSTKFEGSQSLPPNKIFVMDFNKRDLLTVSTFTTKENPYYFGDE